MRLTIRKLGLLSAVSFSLLLLLFVLNEFFGNSFTPSNLRKLDMNTKKQIHYSNYRFSDLDSLTAEHPDFKTLSLNDKCKVFFDEYEQNHKGWSFPRYDGNKYVKDIDKFEDYVRRVQKKQQKEMSSFELTKSDRDKIRATFKTMLDETLEIDQGMADFVSIMRVYGKCFITNEDRDQKLYNDITAKVFPYLEFNLPVFETLGDDNKPIRFNNGLPEYGESEFSGSVKEPTKDSNLIQFYRENINGRGIVISAASKHSKDVVRLIRVLRALGNTLPIEIVYRSNFNSKSKDLVTVAGKESLEEALKAGPPGSLPPDVHASYPPQTIMFNNIKRLVTGKLFSGYNNKLLALVFSSFQEVILIDADTVPLIELDKFFQSKQYLNTSTMFFKDRSLRDTNDYLETNYFQRLFPMNSDSLDSLFDIPTIPKSKLIGNNYLRGYRHYQEAGMVVIDKSRHFLATLMLMPLGMWREPIKTAVWGDKEFYWISMLMAGDQDFEFNEYEAASVGVESSNSMKIYDFHAHEVCSTHPGHVNENFELLWINSGFKFCKKNGFYRDRDQYPFQKIKADELRDTYEKPLLVTHAVIPPPLPDLRDLGDEVNLQKEKNIKRKWKKRKKDSDEINEFGKNGIMTPKIDYAPQKGWVKNPICSGYYYCAYDVVEGQHSGVYDIGQFIAFNESTVSKFETLGRMWALDPPKVPNIIFTKVPANAATETSSVPVLQPSNIPVAEEVAHV